MNRQQKRKLKRQNEKNVSYMLNKDQIDALKIRSELAGLQDGFILMLGIPCIAMRDSFGFGRTRMTRFMDKVIDIYEAVMSGHVGLEDLIKEVNDETGVDIINVWGDCKEKYDADKGKTK